MPSAMLVVVAVIVATRLPPLAGFGGEVGGGALHAPTFTSPLLATAELATAPLRLTPTHAATDAASLHTSDVAAAPSTSLGGAAADARIEIHRLQEDFAMSPVQSAAVPVRSIHRALAYRVRAAPRLCSWPSPAVRGCSCSDARPPLLPPVRGTCRRCGQLLFSFRSSALPWQQPLALTPLRFCVLCAPPAHPARAPPLAPPTRCEQAPPAMTPFPRFPFPRFLVPRCTVPLRFRAISFLPGLRSPFQVLPQRSPPAIPNPSAAGLRRLLRLQSL